MPEVDFYVVSDRSQARLLEIACRVTEKAWSRGLRVYVLAVDEEQAARADEMLWTFRAESFVPHERWTGSAPPGAPVLVGATGQPAPPPEVLVNLGAPIPAWFRDCARVAEVVGGEAGARAEARQRYRAYREAGLAPRSHEVA